MPAGRPTDKDGAIERALRAVEETLQSKRTVEDTLQSRRSFEDALPSSQRSQQGVAASFADALPGSKASPDEALEPAFKETREAYRQEAKLNVEIIRGIQEKANATLQQDEWVVIDGFFK
jgi:hypothetical protein